MMFNEVLNKIKANKLAKERGEKNSIEWPFPRLKKVFPGFTKGSMVLCCANSGVGKTQISKFLVIFNTYNFCKKHNIAFHIKWFALEESVEEFVLSLIGAYVYDKYQEEIDLKVLRSIGESLLSDEQLKKVEEARAYVEDVLKYVDVQDSILNRTGIYKHVRDYARVNGKFYFENREVTPPESLDWENFRYDTYRANNPEEYVFVVVDNLNILLPEKGESLMQTMEAFVTTYCLNKFSKKFNYISYNIQQMASDKEQVEYNYKGTTIEEKLEPSLSGLGDSKKTQRDMHLVISLFSPVRYNIAQHRKYNIGVLKNNYRSLKILKDRFYGLGDNYVPLYFNGAANYFRELPLANDKEMEIIYESLK